MVTKDVHDEDDEAPIYTQVDDTKAIKEDEANEEALYQEQAEDFLQQVGNEGEDVESGKDSTVVYRMKT